MIQFEIPFPENEELEPVFCNKCLFLLDCSDEEKDICTSSSKCNKYKFNDLPF